MINLNGNKIYLAFHKGNKTLLDKAIKFTSRGIYSHVEIFTDRFSYSSSGRWGGTTRKGLDAMNFNDPKKWDIYVIDENIIKKLGNGDNIIGKVQDRIDVLYMDKMRKKKYDYYSIIVYHLLRLSILPRLRDDEYLCTDAVLKYLEYGFDTTLSKMLNNINEPENFKYLADNPHMMSPDNLFTILASMEIISEKISIEDQINIYK